MLSPGLPHSPTSISRVELEMCVCKSGSPLWCGQGLLFIHLCIPTLGAWHIVSVQTMAGNEAVSQYHPERTEDLHREFRTTNAIVPILKHNLWKTENLNCEPWFGLRHGHLQRLQLRSNPEVISKQQILFLPFSSSVTGRLEHINNS